MPLDGGKFGGTLVSVEQSTRMNSDLNSVGNTDTYFGFYPVLLASDLILGEIFLV